MDPRDDHAALVRRHGIHLSGSGELTLLFLPGLGCDQAIWQHVAPAFVHRAQVLCMDLVGFGQSDHGQWSEATHGTLEGHAADVAAVVRAFAAGRCVVVGHSVSAMLGMLADLQAPGTIVGHAMVGPSPCYLNDGDYTGGFTQDALVETARFIGSDVRSWIEAALPLQLAPTPGHPAAAELTGGVLRANPRALARMAQATLLSDLRPLLPQLKTPVLVLQSDQDMVAPMAVARYMQARLPNCRLHLIRNPGHCPHLTHPGEVIEAIGGFLDTL